MSKVTMMIVKTIYRLSCQQSLESCFNRWTNVWNYLPKKICEKLYGLTCCFDYLHLGQQWHSDEEKKYLLFYQVSTTKHFRQIQAFRDCGSLYDAATFRTYRQFSSSSHKETDFIQIAVFQTFVYLIEQILFQLLQTTVHLGNTCERNTIRSKPVIKYHEKVHLVQFRQYQLQRVGRVK